MAFEAHWKLILKYICDMHPWNSSQMGNIYGKGFTDSDSELFIWT